MPRPMPRPVRRAEHRLQKKRIGDQVVDPPTAPIVIDPTADVSADADATPTIEQAQAAMNRAQAVLEAAKAQAIANRFVGLVWDPNSPRLLMEDGRELDAPSLHEEPERTRHRTRLVRTSDGTLCEHVADHVQSDGFVRWIYREANA